MNAHGARKRLALLPVALLLAGCGGGSGSDESGGGGDAAARAAEEPVPGDEFTNDPAYRQGTFSCNTFTVGMLAQDYGVKADAKTVARAVAKDIEPSDKKKQDRAYQGCLDVLGTG